MMKGGERSIRNNIIVPLFAVVLIGGTLFVVPSANAQTPTPAPVHTGFFQGLIDFFAQRFGLEKTQVQSALQDYHKGRVDDREKMRLDKLVTAGKITSSQEQAILTELASIRSHYNLGTFQNLTPDQRKTQMQNIQNDLKSWAQTQGIDVNYVLPMPGMRGRFDKKMGQWKRWNANPSGTPSATPTP